MTRYALVPVEATQEMLESESRIDETKMQRAWSAMLAASPGQGAVTAEQVEAAAEAVHRNSTSGRAWSRMGEDWKAVYRTHARAALEALGLTVQP